MGGEGRGGREESGEVVRRWDEDSEGRQKRGGEEGLKGGIERREWSKCTLHLFYSQAARRDLYTHFPGFFFYYKPTCTFGTHSLQYIVTLQSNPL